MVFHCIKKYAILVFMLLLTIFLPLKTWAQEVGKELNTTTTYNNQLFFNRFFLNPTFSLVRENKSYLNILHRNQYTAFEDNRQNYFLGFSNKLNEHTALGIGLYSQWSGVVQEFGFNANYATAVKLSQKSKLTFGTNLLYFTEGLDKNRVVAISEDSKLSSSKKESKLSIQPGLNLSLGKIDIGLYAKDLLKYNQTTNEFLFNLSEKSVQASLQYTHTFGVQKGILENARLMPLLRVGKTSENQFAYIGSLVFDIPKYGWLQTNYDTANSMSLGLGVNLSKKMAIGYLLEKESLEDNTDLGWNHEVTLAYSFSKADDSKEWASKSTDEKIDEIVAHYEDRIAALTTQQSLSPEEEAYKNKLTINKLAHENRMILDELILRQDSMEVARNEDLERRFESIVRAVRSDIKQSLKSNLQTPSIKKTSALVLNQPKNAQQKENENAKKIRHQRFKEIPMKMLSQSNIVGAQSGYYVIANVYKNKKYLNSFMNDLKSKGLNAKNFYNKENGLHYVYLADYDYKNDAKNAIYSNLDGSYKDEKWVMEVVNTSSIVHNSYE